MRKTIIAGNWKMNKTVAETKATLSELKELTNGRELYNNYLIQDRCHKKVSYKIQIRKV